MGEIIRPNFGRLVQRPETKNPELLPASPPGADKVVTLVQADLNFLVTNPARVEAATQRIDAITEYIFSIPNFEKKDNNIDLRRDALQLTSLEQFCIYLLSTTEINWKAKPSFFGAVILEMDMRLKMIQSLNNGLKK